MKKLFAALLLVLIPLGVSATTTSPPSFSIANATCSEAAATCSVAITRSGTVKSYSQLAFATHDGTAKAGAAYQAVNLTVTFFVSDPATKVVKVPLINNSSMDPAVTFTATIARVRNATISRGTATITVTDDDMPPPPPLVVWTHCANQGETCYLKAPANVRYGANGSYFSKGASISILCDVSSFGGDPIFGELKTCDTDGQVGTAPPPAPPPVIVGLPLPDPAQYPNPCLGALGEQIAGSWCPARKCPGYPSPVQVNYPCPAVVKP